LVKIAELIRDGWSEDSRECELIVSSDTPVGDVLEQIAEKECEFVGVSSEDGTEPKVISRDDVVRSVLEELDNVQDEVFDVYRQIDEGVIREYGLFAEGISWVEREKNRLELAIENISEGVIIFDREGKVGRVNNSAKKLLGLRIDADSEDIFTEVETIGLKELMSSKDNYCGSGDRSIKVKVGTDKILQMRWTEIIDSRENHFGRIVLLRDATNEIEVEKAKRDFIMSISHELRTPLTSIQNSVSNILAGVTGKIGLKTRDYLDTMKKDCHRFADLINDLLDMAKLEAGNMPVNRKVVNMSVIIDEVISVFKKEAESKGIEVVSSIEGHIPPIYADPQRIGQVLWNLLGNAIKFTNSDGGRVKIHCVECEDNVVTSVEDNGIGIAANQQTHIFSKFHQVGREAGAGYKGTGLGLAICEGIIGMHGGSIWVESRENEGSKFFFSLPKSEPVSVLSNHLGILAERCRRESDKFAMLVARFDFPEDQQTQLRGIVRALTSNILTECDHLMVNNDDMVIQTGDFEVIFIVRERQRGHIEAITQKIHKIVDNRLRKNCGEAPIVPMFGMAFYPGDLERVDELERLARGNMEKMF
jgi:signal transduction histidine kinase